MTKLGIVKNYLKFTHDALFGVIGCDHSNILFLPNRDGNIGSLCMVGFAENVIIWNLKTYQTVKTLHGKMDDKVSYLSYFYSVDFGLYISIGYDSGYVSVYDLSTYELVVTSKIHKHSISYILHNGNRLMCGSKDTTITIIDVDDERGFKLEGHKSSITKLHYISKKDVLISSSQDGEIKFWLLTQKRCFKTLTNPNETWDFFYCDTRNLLVTGSSDTAMRLWKLDFNKIDNDPFDGSGETTMTDRYSNAIQATPVPGEVNRQSPQRVVELKIDETGNYLVCNTHEKCLELYKVLTEAELKKKLQKKMKKAAKTKTDPAEVCIKASDRLKLLKVIELPYRCKRIDIHTVAETKSNRAYLEVLASMYNNTIAVFTVPVSGTEPTGTDSKSFTMRTSISQCGHRTAIIHCQLTSDNLGIFTASLSEAKLWSKGGLECLATAGWTWNYVRENDDAHQFNMIFTELGLANNAHLDANAALLLPGDRHALIAFKNGVMFLYDLVVVSVIQYVKRHTESISALVLTHDQTSVLSASADKSLLVWNLEYSNSTISNPRGKLSLVCKEASEPFKNAISSVAVTPDGKLFIIGFMDSKVRTYLTTDTNRRVLDLYGHSMPVTSISVKYDSSQLLTGSLDKSVRSWNLPHGDSKIFKGHTEPVTDVRYIPGRSMALSCDKSGLIIQIELSNMSEIIRLRGHGNSVSCLSVIASGTEADGDELANAEFVSVSTDRSIRLWYESEDILVREVEEMEQQDRCYENEEMAREKIVIVGAPSDTGINVLTTKTMSTESYADQLMEAIDIYDKIRIDPATPIDPLMSGKGFSDAGGFVMHTITRINGLDLELALAQLPITYVALLLEILADHVARELHVSLASRCFMFLAKLHFMIIKRDEKFIPVITKMAKFAKLFLQRDLDVIGFNLAAFEYHKKLFGPEFISFAEQRSVKKAKSKKNK